MYTECEYSNTLSNFCSKSSSPAVFGLTGLSRWSFSLSLLHLPSEMREKSHSQEQTWKKYLNSLEIQTASDIPRSHGRCMRAFYCTCPWPTPVWVTAFCSHLWWPTGLHPFSVILHLKWEPRTLSLYHLCPSSAETGFTTVCWRHPELDSEQQQPRSLLLLAYSPPEDSHSMH